MEAEHLTATVSHVDNDSENRPPVPRPKQRVQRATSTIDRIRKTSHVQSLAQAKATLRDNSNVVFVNKRTENEPPEPTKRTHRAAESEAGQEGNTTDHITLAHYLKLADDFKGMCEQSTQREQRSVQALEQSLMYERENQKLLKQIAEKDEIIKQLKEEVERNSMLNRAGNLISFEDEANTSTAQNAPVNNMNLLLNTTN